MKKIIIVGSGLFICVAIAIGLFLIYPKVQKETVEANPSIKELFNKGGNYYIYFTREDCRYCDNIEKDMESFLESNRVYVVDSSKLVDTKSYDWNEHAKEADVEIGEIDKDGSVIFYDQLTQNDIMELYSPVYYKIISASASYAEFNDGKREGKIYAVSTHPKLTEGDLSPENFIIPGVPFLVEIDNDKVINYYFDDKEIIDFLDSDTNALDSYWNLD